MLQIDISVSLSVVKEILKETFIVWSRDYPNYNRWLDLFLKWDLRSRKRRIMISRRHGNG